MLLRFVQARDSHPICSNTGPLGPLVGGFCMSNVMTKISKYFAPRGQWLPSPRCHIVPRNLNIAFPLNPEGSLLQQFRDITWKKVRSAPCCAELLNVTCRLHLLVNEVKIGYAKDGIFPLFNQEILKDLELQTVEDVLKSNPLPVILSITCQVSASFLSYLVARYRCVIRLASHIFVDEPVALINLPSSVERVIEWPVAATHKMITEQRSCAGLSFTPCSTVKFLVVLIRDCCFQHQHEAIQILGRIFPEVVTVLWEPARCRTSPMSSNDCLKNALAVRWPKAMVDVNDR